MYRPETHKNKKWKSKAINGSKKNRFMNSDA